ncbi:MAG: hypothetical protein ACJLUP_12390 [Agrobacterium tumefaciens]
MNKPTRIAFIGTSPPRQCGIATFTGDLSHAMSESAAGVSASSIAITDEEQNYDYPPDVIFEIRESRT